MIPSPLRLTAFGLAFSLFALMLILPLLGLLGPKPGAPLGQRSLGIWPVWLTRIVETSSMQGSSVQSQWRTEGNWPAIMGSAVLLGFSAAGLFVARRTTPRKPLAAV